jgi:enoyl-CoA hydratase/carnithine racemase
MRLVSMTSVGEHEPARRFETVNLYRLATSADFIEGVSAFLRKRQPDFSGA